MLLRSMQNTQELADAKAENDALRDDVAAGRRRLHKLRSARCRCVSACLPRRGCRHLTWRYAERDYFTLRRLITMQKQLEGTQKYINEQCE